MDCNIKGVTKESNVGIYKITNRNNNKSYIGQSIELLKRSRTHKNLLKTNKHFNVHLQRSYNRGDSLLLEVLELCEINELDEKENFWIKFFETTDREYGYNFEGGGNSNRVKHPETIRKSSERMIVHFSDINNRIELSRKKSTMSDECVSEIKTLLRFTNKTPKEIAELCGVNEHKVTHISTINTFDYILPQYNYYVKHRASIKRESTKRKIMNLYRLGKSYKDISLIVQLDERNVIRIAQDTKNEHDERCRLNVLNRERSKKSTIVKTLNAMGYNDIQMSKLLKGSRSYISDIRKGKLDKPFANINEVRSIPKPFAYKLNRLA